MRGRNPTGWGKSEISWAKRAKEPRPEEKKEESVGVNRRKNSDRKRKKRNQSGETDERTPTGSGKNEISRAKQTKELRLEAEKWNQSGGTGGRTPTGREKSGIGRVEPKTEADFYITLRNAECDWLCCM